MTSDPTNPTTSSTDSAPVVVQVAFTYRNSVLVPISGPTGQTSRNDVINQACRRLEDEVTGGDGTLHTAVYSRLQEDGVLRTWPEYSRVLRSGSSAPGSAEPGVPDPEPLEGDSERVTPDEHLTRLKAALQGVETLFLSVRVRFQFAAVLDVLLNAQTAAGKSDEQLIGLAERRIKPGDDLEGPEFARVLALVLHSDRAVFHTRPQDSEIEDD